MNFLATNMKITKIEIVDGKILSTSTNGKIVKLYPVLLTYRTWKFGKEKTMKAFPTCYGPTFNGEDIVYFYYCDKIGNRLEEVSEQINNFLLTVKPNI